MGTVVLPGPPPLAPLFVRALLAARDRRVAPLSDHRVAVRGLAVDPARVADYARQFGFAVDDRLPLTWPHLPAFRLQVALMSDPSFPLALPGLVHVANRIVWRRPVRLDDVLDIDVWADTLAAHRRGTAVNLHAVVGVGGIPVWESTSTYLARGVTAPPGSPSVAPDVALDRAPQPAAVWRLPADAGRRYAHLSGDVNPVHLGAWPARAFGFRRAIAHGMATAARVAASLEGRLPDAGRYEVGFRAPVYLPSTVVLATTPAGGGWDVTVASRDGEPVHLVGTVRPQ